VFRFRIRMFFGFPDPRQVPLVRGRYGRDPRIRIRTKMSRIRKTALELRNHRMQQFCIVFCVIYFLYQVTSEEQYRNHVTALDLLAEGGDLFPGLDYSLLCAGSESCAQWVTVETVGRLEQAVAAIPPLSPALLSSPAPLTPARLRLMLAEKVFFQHGAATDNWIEAFRYKSSIVDEI
jgi:hypothetical protein